MIGRLCGKVAERASLGVCILDVQGVGYEIFVADSLWESLQKEQELTLHVHTHVREDALSMYGFVQLADKQAFRQLMSVSSIGPKLALAIVNKLDASALALAVARADASAFRGISGVGKRTVERLFIDLKDKMSFASPPSLAAAQGADAGAQAPLLVVTSALVQMGYRMNEAERAVAGLQAGATDRPIEVLLREALAALSA